jgi:hypothetical protein
MAGNSESLDEDVMFDSEAPERDRELGGLVDPAGDVDDEADAIALEDRETDPTGVDRAPQDQGEVVPAEEAAMHLTEDPPFDADDDGYVED